jgi:hypothetical protein
MAKSFRLLRGTSVQWADANPVLAAGEQGYETDTHRYKIGDGYSRWLELDAYVPESELKELIDQALADAGAGENAVSNIAFVAHINDPNPHPNYDDGASFLLAYENAKV